MLSHHVIIIPVYIDVKSPWSNLFVYPFEIYPIKSLRLSDTLWLFNSLPWYRWPIEIDGLPIKNMVIFHGELLVITRWYIQRKFCRKILAASQGRVWAACAPGSAHPVPGPRRAGRGWGDGGWPKWVSSKKPRDLTKIFKHYQLNIFWYPRFLFLGISGVLVKVFPWVFAIFMPVLKLIGVLDVGPTLVRFHGGNEVPRNADTWGLTTNCMAAWKISSPPCASSDWTWPTTSLHLGYLGAGGKAEPSPADHMVIMAWSIWMTSKVDTSDLISKYLWGQTC